MEKISKALATVAESFISALNNSSYQTETGKNLIQKYQSYTMANSVDCSLVNSFMKEAKECLYDSGVQSVYEAIGMMITSNKYSWLLESACEKIERTSGSRNYLDRNAAKRVRPLLEMEEADVVTYIKAGALKEVMYCESFRNIAKSIFNETPVVESNAEYTAIHPISVIEKKDDSIYFTVEGKLYKITESEVSEALPSEVSNEYRVVSSLLESNLVSYSNGTVTYKDNNYTISISEAGKCKKTVGEKVYEYTAEQLREQNALYLRNFTPAMRKNREYVLESLAKTVENFDNVVILNNVSVFETKNDRFMIIESISGKAYAKLLSSNHSSDWSVNENMLDVVNFIKKKTNTDLTERYSEKIESVIEEASEKDAEMLRESIERDAIQQRRSKIEELTQKFKNDPVKLAVLSKVAQDLNEL